MSWASRGAVADDNPWQGTTLVWSAVPDRAYRPPYEYSVPGAEKDYLPQGEKSGL
jgi:cytochrome c oxidase subunit 1